MFLIPNVICSNTTTMADPMVLLNDIDRYIAITTSEESLKSFSIRLVDIFGQLVMTFKTNLTKFYKGLKRSELKFYIESNMLQANTVKNANYIDIKDVYVPTPNGLKPNTTYLSIIEDTNEVYNVLSMLELSKSIYSAMENVYIKLQENEEYSIQAISNTLKVRSNVIEKAYNKLVNNFTDTHTKDVKFSTVFSSMDEFKKCISMLVNMESRLQDTHSLLNILEKIDTIATKVIDYIQKPDTTVSKLFIQDLSLLIRNSAVLFETYGDCVNYQMSIEHNLTFVIKSIFNHLT